MFQDPKIYTGLNISSSGSNEGLLKQDPENTALSTLGVPIGIPNCVTVKKSKLNAANGDGVQRKKRRRSSEVSMTEEIPSDDDELADLAFLLSADDDEETERSKDTLSVMIISYVYVHHKHYFSQIFLTLA